MSQNSQIISCCDNCADRECCEINEMLKCDTYLHHIKKIIRGLV